MITIAHTVAAAGAGIPDASWAVLSLPTAPAEIVAAVGALVVATVGVLVVRSLNGCGHQPPSVTQHPEPGPGELRKAA